MELLVVPVDKPEGLNVILGQSHFIKTVEDIHEALVGTGPHLRFGLAFCEASGPCLVRRSGNDDELTALAVRNAQSIGAGHSFVVFLRDGFPVNVMNALKAVPEVCTIFCATANELEVVVAATDQGRGIVGVVDGFPPLGVETDEDVAARAGPSCGRSATSSRFAERGSPSASPASGGRAWPPRSGLSPRRSWCAGRLRARARHRPTRR